MNNNDISPHDKVNIVFEPDGNQITLPSGSTIFDAAIKSGNNLRFECGGKGKCGKCKVIVTKINALSKITKYEKKHLNSLEIKSGGTYNATSGTTTITSENSDGFCVRFRSGANIAHNSGLVNISYQGICQANLDTGEGTNHTYDVEIAVGSGNSVISICKSNLS